MHITFTQLLYTVYSHSEHEAVCKHKYVLHQEYIRDKSAQPPVPPYYIPIQKGHSKCCASAWQLFKYSYVMHE